MTSGAVRIGLLKHRAAGDALAARRRLEMVLSGADISPGGLAPWAVLCVRRLEDPRPGLLRLDVAAIRPPPAWSLEVTNALEVLAHSAAHPADGGVPANALAVLFRDRTELLACLSEDWATRGALANWWWRELARGWLGIATAWRAEIVRVPAIVDLLARRGSLEQVLQAMSTAEIRGIASTLASRYGLGRLADVLASDSAVPQVPRAVAAHPEPPGSSSQSATRTSAAVMARRLPPWRRVTRISETADPIVAALVGVALTLHRAPAVAHSRQFADETAVWLADREAIAPRRDKRRAAVAAPQPHSPEQRVADARPGRMGPTGIGERTRPDDVSEQQRSSQPVRAARSVGHARSRGSNRRSTSTLISPGPPSATRQTASVRGSEPMERTSVVVRSLPEHQPARPSQPLDEPILHRLVIQTELGGVFYLLNLALYLGLYGDFTKPDGPGIELNPWDFVTLLSADLGAVGALPEDPIWPLLTRLAGRDPGSRPGVGFRPPGDWRVPAAWMLPFAGGRGAQPWTWSSAHSRLRIDHPEGFRVVDIASPRAAERSARTAIRGYGPGIALRRSTLATARPGRSVDVWIARVAAYARARLRLALALDPADDLAAILFLHRAHIFVGASVIDVELRLADLPIALRAAGLDRDPGWIPAAGRTIAFHYA